MRLPTLVPALLAAGLMCPSARPADATLSFLSLAGPEVSPAFSPDVLTYTMAAPGELDRTTVWALASDPAATVEVTVNGSTPVRLAPGPVLDAGRGNGLALDSTGSAVAWGLWDYGIPAGAYSGVTSVDTGSFRSFALREDGSALVWGRDLASPQVLRHPAGIARISMGDNGSAVLLRDGTVKTWGSDGLPVHLPPNNSGFVAVSVQDGTFLGLRKNGSVAQWGGKGSPPPAASSDVIAIATGRTHNLALKADGSVLAWAYEREIQGFVPALASSGVTAIAAGHDSSLALRSDGSVVSWINRGTGQATVLADTSEGIVAIATDVVPFGLRADGSVLVLDQHTTFGQTPLPAGYAAPRLSPGMAAAPRLPLSTGVNKLEVRVTSRDGLSSRTYAVAIRRAPTNARENWRQAHFGSLANTGTGADVADPDGDGLPNLLEFATQTPPSSPGRHPARAGRQGDLLTFTYPRSKAALADGVSFVVEWAENPWAQVWSSDGVVSVSQVDQGDHEEVTAHIPAGPGTARFVRLRVTQN